MAFWAFSAQEALTSVEATPDGLSSAQADQRRASYGANEVAGTERTGLLRELLSQFSQPTVLILLVATVLAMLLGDVLDASIILAIVVLSGLLGWWQEHQASRAVAGLLARVTMRSEVLRDGEVRSIDPVGVVPGDIVVLNAGDVVPADCRVLTAEALQVDEAALTGEAYPRHKTPEPVAGGAALGERRGALFRGSHVVSGEGTAVVIETGARTELGRLAGTLRTRKGRTGFEEGSARFGLLLARVTAGLTAIILVVNLVLGRPVVESVLFSLALALGVTPQMLPAIVAVSLSVGARRLAAASVLVRRLDAIEDLGSMELLCTDKTGTLTVGEVSLTATLDPDGAHSDQVAAWAVVNAGLQTGFTNPLDLAVLRGRRAEAGWSRLAELPFDFERKRLSVLADSPDGRWLVTKGAVEPVLSVCALTDERRAELRARFESLSADGHRVLGLAARRADAESDVEERDLDFAGFLVFDDPVKEGLPETVEMLATLGVRLCMLTGDNRLVARHVCTQLGVAEPTVLTGAEVDALDDDQLAAAVGGVTAFAELTPLHKERVLQAARHGGTGVGYLGDGINDTGPLRMADVGISVDSAVDVAKAAAALVLLDKDLRVVVDGIRLGRQTFANTVKYVNTTISANFGNTLSMAIASMFLPFLPLLPRQVLLLNFLSDLPSVALAGDRVDPEDLDRPRRWDMRQVAGFMVVFGLLSSVFDMLAFAVLLWGFDADATLFRTGWFIGSAITEIAVLFVLRTRRTVLRSRPGQALVWSSVVVALVTLGLPWVPGMAEAFALDRPDLAVVSALLALVAAYVVTAELVKRWWYARMRRNGRII